MDNDFATGYALGSDSASGDRNNSGFWGGDGCDSPDGQAGQIKRHTPPCLSGARGFSEKDCGGKHEIKI